MEEDDQGKLMRKIKEDPFVPIGVLGMLGVLGYGAYKYKSARKVMSTSLFLIQLRMAAQGTVVGCMALGMIYNMAKMLSNKDQEKGELRK